MATPQDFSEELKRWRARLKLTQVQAAAKLDVHYDALRDWELGRTKPAHLGPVRRVMKLALDEAKTDASAR